MRPSNLLAITKKEIKQLLRDRRTLALVVLQPIVVILVFGYSVYQDVNNVTTALYIQGNAQEAEKLWDIVEKTEAFHITKNATSIEEVRDAVQNGAARAGLIFNISGASPPTLNITLVYDSTNPIVEAAVRKGMVEVSENATKNFTSQLPPPPRVELITIKTEAKFGSYTFFESYTPGVIAMAMFYVSLSIAALSLIKERTSGTLERILVTPYTKTEILLGKLAGNLFVAVSAGATSLIIVFGVFNIYLKGDLLTVLFIDIVVGVVSLGHGLLVSAFVKSEREAVQITSYLFFIYLFLSNFIWPLEAMHWVLQYLRFLCFLNPAVNALNGVMLRGLSIWEVGFDLAILGLFGVAFMAGGILAFRREIKRT